MAGDLDPEKLTIVALETKWDVEQACPGRLACIIQVGDNAVIFYKHRDVDSLWHERGHLKYPEKFETEFKQELARYQ